MLKLMSQPRTTFMTSAMEYILMPLISTVMKPKETAERARDGSPKRSLQVARHRVGLGDVIERDHHDRQEQHGGDRADPIPVRGENAVLIGSAGPAHQFERTEVGGQEAEARDPGGHLAAGQEKVLAGLGEALQVEADSEDGNEVQNNDGEIDARERQQA